MFLSNLCMCVQPCAGMRAINIMCDQTHARTHVHVCIRKPKKTKQQTEKKPRCMPHVCVCVRVKTRDLVFDGATCVSTAAGRRARCRPSDSGRSPPPCATVQLHASHARTPADSRHPLFVVVLKLSTVFSPLAAAGTRFPKSQASICLNSIGQKLLSVRGLTDS